MTVVFDSHGFVKRLTAAGMPEPQAEAPAVEHTRWFDDGLATKADLAPLAKTTDLADFARKADLADFAKKIDLADLAKKAELKEMELRLDVRIEAMKSDILKWIIGLVGLQTFALLGAVLALAKALH